MNLRIAYYVVAFAISLAAFAGAYGYANAYAITARTAADEAASHPGVLWANYFGLLSTDASAEAVAERANSASHLIAVDNRINAAALSAVGAARAAAAAERAAAAARIAYVIAAAVALAAFAGAYILDKRRVPPEG